MDDRKADPVAGDSTSLKEGELNLSRNRSQIHAMLGAIFAC